MPPRNLAPRTLALLGGGILALVVAGVVLFLANPFGLGPDELPESIGDSEREDIGDTLAAFFAGVDQYNPQVAGETMLTPGELGIEEFARMVFEIAAVESAQLTFSFRSLGATELDGTAGLVRAVAATELGNVPVELVRRGGQWRVSAVPDLRIPEDRAPYRFEWEVTNSYGSDDGRTLSVIGELRNTGDSPWLVLGMPGALMGADGEAIRVDPSNITTRPFVDPGESYPFRVDFNLPNGAEGVDPSGFRPIPNIRVAHPADRNLLASALTVDPAEHEATPEQFQVVVTNGESEARSARVIALVESANGQLLDVLSSAAGTVPGGGSQTFELGGVNAATIETADVIRIETWGTIRA